MSKRFESLKLIEGPISGPLVLKYTFKYGSFEDVYEANTQIRRRKNGDVDITVGFYGDEFPCIILHYNSKENVFKIDRIRAQAFGGYSSDDRMLCIRNIRTKTFLPERGSLDILIMLSLGIFEHLYENRIIDNKNIPSVLIKDMAMKDEYPLSWLKYFKNFGTDITPEITYSKYGFRIRGTKNSNLCDDYYYYDIPNTHFSYENYVNDEIPKILSLNMKDTLRKFNKNDYDKFMNLLNDFNKVLIKKRIKRISIEKDTDIILFIMSVFETKRQNEYKQLLCHLDSMIHFDIRGHWYLDYKFYKNLENSKVKIFKIEEI